MCSNKDCPYQSFHPSCLSLTSIAMPKTWYCPHCCRLPQFKRRGNTRKSPRPTVVADHAVMKHDSICICKAKPTPTDKLVECHGESCTNGKYFHLSCLGLKRYPNNHRTTWKCPPCKKVTPAQASDTSTTCSSSQIPPVVRMKVMLSLRKSPRVKLIRPVHWQIYRTTILI